MASLGVQTVALDEYFDDRPGLRILRPESSYLRRPAILLNPDVPGPILRNSYLRNPIGNTPREGVAVFNDATLFGTGNVRLEDGRILAESIEKPNRAHFTPTLPADWTATRRFDTGVTVAKTGSGNYGHFLVEMLPRLVLNAGAYPADAPILIHRQSKRFALPMLEQFGFDTARVAWIGSEPVHVKTLYWPTRNTFHPFDQSPHIFPLLSELARGLGGPSPHRQLFVGRKDATTRQLVNDDEVFATLRPHGFERVSPGHMSFRDQIQAFAEARVIVGVSGAALTNLVFMPAGGTIVMLAPATMSGWFFWDIASHCRHTFFVLWGEIVGSRSARKNADFRVNPDELPDVWV